MKISDILESLNEIQRYIVYLLFANNIEPIKRKLWLQKEIFLVSKNISEIEYECNFVPHIQGPYSEELDESLNILQNLGIVKIQGQYDGEISLSDIGIKIANDVKKQLSPEKRDIIEDMKGLLNDLNENELLAFVYFSFPDMKENSAIFYRIEPLRESLALKLYSKEKVSLEKGAQIAGKSVQDFILEVKKRGIREVYSK